MGSIIKVNEYKDFNNNDIMTSDGAGVVTPNAAGLKNTPAFFVTQTSAQAIANNTSVTLSFGTTVFDTDSAMSSTTFTVPSGAAGKYFFYAAYRVNTTTNSARLATDIKVNGSSIISWNTQNDDEDSSQASGYADLSVGDAVTVTAFQTTGGSVNTKNTTNTVFGGHKLIGA
mgnify:FL=1